MAFLGRLTLGIQWHLAWDVGVTFGVGGRGAAFGSGVGPRRGEEEPSMTFVEWLANEMPSLGIGAALQLR